MPTHSKDHDDRSPLAILTEATLSFVGAGVGEPTPTWGNMINQGQLVLREAPWVTIAHSVVYEPIRKNVTGYKVDPFGLHVFYGVDIN